MDYDISQEELASPYWERNQLVRFLTKHYASFIGIDSSQDEEWQYVVYVQIPDGQLSWHIHRDEIHKYFGDLAIVEGQHWDGHTTEQKYRRLLAYGDAKF